MSKPEEMPCGCVPHVTRMRGMWGFYCETEDQGYCNFECPHEDEEEREEAIARSLTALGYHP